MNNINCRIQTNRIEWIDYVKGIAIYLVVIGHAIENMYGESADYNFFHIAIYSFHMPLFFMLSGALFSDKKYNSFKKFSLNKFFSLIIPSYVFAIIALFIDIIKERQIFFGIKEITRMLLQFRVESLANYWFLPTLFFAFIIMWFVHKIFNSDIKRLICSLLFSIMGAVYISIIAKPLPFSLDNAFLVSVFMELGYQIKDHIQVIRNKKYVIIVSGILWGISTYLNYECFGKISISLAYVTLLNPIIFFVSAISGSVFVLLLCSKICKRTRVNIWGNHTLTIYLIGGIVLNLLIKWTRIIDINNVWAKGLICIIMSVITIEISILFSIFIKKYFPYILGEKKHKDKEKC